MEGAAGVEQGAPPKQRCAHQSCACARFTCACQPQQGAACWRNNDRHVGARMRFQLRQAWGGKLYGTRCGASGDMPKRLLRRADAAQECSHGGMVAVNGEFEGSSAVPAMRRVRGGIWRRARAASGIIALVIELVSCSDISICLHQQTADVEVAVPRGLV